MLSGGFDPLHTGHLNMIRKASMYGSVIIALNSDDWLIRKKGYFLQSFEERKALLENLRHVFSVVSVDDTDGTVLKALEEYRPTYFGNGGDRKADNTPEVSLCNKLDIDCIWNLGDPSTDNIHSSFIMRKNRVERAWGHYEVLVDTPWCKVKRLVVNPGKSTSKQYHNERTEFMFSKDFQVMVKPGQIHQIVNHDDKDLLEIIEVQTGNCIEDDIVRIPK
jgi:D-beta-D-heptose 7-phosphate kinase/D-beta-D-heptose 1-phosphate adenosyltransferase